MGRKKGEVSGVDSWVESRETSPAPVYSSIGSRFRRHIGAEVSIVLVDRSPYLVL